MYFHSLCRLPLRPDPLEHAHVFEKDTTVALHGVLHDSVGLCCYTHGACQELRWSGDGPLLPRFC